MTGTLAITILGCGSSGGVPRPDGEWGACDPADPRNRRLRCSLLVERWGPEGPDAGVTRALIDTSPDLRQQLLATGVRRLDAVLYSHDHADQAHGIDDLRAIVYAMRRRIATYMDEATAATLTRRFGYIFDEAQAGGYPPILDARAMRAFEPVVVEGEGGPIVAVPLPQVHGAINSLGFRIGPVAYCNDASHLPPETLAACAGAELFIVDALRDLPHPSHAHVALALEWIAAVSPARAVLTNLHIDLDYAALAARLPPGVEPAVDYWRWTGPAA
jgi:phosphoribosyl 1,2-cyclic phosphate phosphodiesterase